jgi:uncharacterized membrane protein HdeD (DUF308 family)
MASVPLTYNRRERVVGALRDHWGWLLALGIVFVVLGTFGLLMALFFTVVSVLLFGALLLVAAVLQSSQAVRARGLKRRLPHVLIALVYAVAGIMMLVDPLDSSIAFTLVLAIFLLVVGGMRLVVAYQLRKDAGWGWALAAGITSIVLGAILLAGWPASGLWAIGLIVAVELIVNGWMCIFLALGARQLRSREADV